MITFPRQRSHSKYKDNKDVALGNFSKTDFNFFCLCSLLDIRIELLVKLSIELHTYFMIDQVTGQIRTKYCF